MRAILPALLGLTLVATGCSDDANPSALDRRAGTVPTTTARPDRAGDDRPATGSGPFVRALAPFADCTAFLDHVRSEALDRVGPYGLDGAVWGWGIEVMAAEATADGAALETAATAPAGGAVRGGDDAGGGDSGTGSFTATNVQELGVDEPDIVKTDGRRIVTISDQVLTVVDVAGDAPVVTGRLRLAEGWNHELFLAGDRALVLTNEGGWGYPMPVEPMIEGDVAGDLIAPVHGGDGPATTVTEIDLTAQPTVLTTVRIEGQYLSARESGGTVRLAISSPPTQLPWLLPQGPAGEERATEANRDVIERSTLEDWTPDYRLTSPAGDRSGPLLDCAAMHHPVDFSGFDVITVVDIDLALGLDAGFGTGDAVGVLASGQTVYASTDRYYVATTEWIGADLLSDDVRRPEWNEDVETEVHAFAIDPDRPTRYVASGSVAGSLLNQFSLDEHDGFLRVITTDGSPWGERSTSETRLVVMQEQGDRLVTVGEVGGLGRGETLYSARLLDDVGFAVTFRQVDPFYVLDLRDPTAPTVTGELKIPGFSTYLHPVSDSLVLGVGQDATPEGRVTGFKLSLFDVGDPAAPREVAVWSMPDANSPAEHDHRAFQMWGSRAIVPVQTWNGEFNGAIVFEIGDASITEVGRITHRTDAVAPSSDCRTIGVDDVPEDSELFWMASDGYSHLQACDQGAIGGWGDWYCDPIPTADLRNWFWDPATADDTLARLGLGDGDRVEVCFPNETWHESIQRSLVIDDEIWTLTPGSLQANGVDDLAVRHHLPLG